MNNLIIDTAGEKIFLKIISDNKEYNIQRVSFEPELPEGSGSKDIDEKERQRGLKILRDAINN